MASTSSEGGGLKAEGGGGGGDATVAEASGVEIKVATGGEEKGQQSSSSGSLVTLRASGALMKKVRRERAGSTAKERISKMPPCTAGKRSSIYRGVTRHRWTGRYEAHLWDKSTWNQNQNKKGKQVYLGAYDDEEAAARAYDLAALKYWGPGTLINFPVTDYSRDLEEMQNISREEYLATLRRKSSGFSRGISKFRSLSSRWEPSLGRTAGPDYFQGMQYGDESVPESVFASRFCMERKIDLTGYIKWWAPRKGRSLDSHTKSSEGSKLGVAEDISRELKSLEHSVLSTQPYQMPQLGSSHEGKKKKGHAASALSILSKSSAYKNMQERVSKIKDIHENDENENKSNINKIDYGKAIEKSDHDDEHERLGVPFGMGGTLLQKSMFPLSPLLSAPLLTSYSAIDPLADPVLWSSLVSGVPSAAPLTAEVTKVEASSTYAFFRQQDET